MRVAYVHDWLVTYRGGEKVLEALLELYPEAPIYTLFYSPSMMPESIRKRTVYAPKWLNRLKVLRKALLPLLPAAIESLPLEDYDLVISTSSCVAKGVMVAPHAKHLCYIHSPMRYIWDQRQHYLDRKRSFSPKEFLIHLLSQRLRMWDVSSNNGVDQFIANSSFVAQRLSRYYARKSSVIHPPVELERFFRAEKGLSKGNYFLVAGAFVSYKRFDIAIAACEALGVTLKVVGSGPDEKRLRKLAGKNTEFVIQPNADEWVKLFQGAKALLFPQIEDFGITAIEALASGTPLIALKAGGALDFVEEGHTGLFFKEQTVDSIKAVIRDFDNNRFDANKLEAFAKKFSKKAFLENIRRELNALEGLN
ncbi:MAG: glycosyltransferase family 4 protein [Proteobacteria bacterium]|nr:MAG: glycosyltransferase family 4 protein [Pseudomonadota bacterium]